MISMWSNFMVSKPTLLPIVRHYTITEERLFMQFLLDPSCLPLVILNSKADPDIMKHCLYLSRTWCFSSHLARSKLLRQMNLR